MISTIGAKEGLSHFVLAAIARGDTVLCPDPCYPIHSFSVLIAGGDIRRVPLLPLDGLLERLEEATQASWPRPKMLIASFPHNPTTATVDLPYLTRMVDFCRRHDLIFVHDLAYAEICYDGYQPPSALQVPGALDCTIEFTSLSKSHAMAGWRVGFGAGNAELRAHALAREELPRLRHLPADPDRHDRRARRPAGLRRRDRRGLPRAPQRADRRPRSGGLEDRKAARDDVRLGAAAGALRRARVARVLEARCSRRPTSPSRPESASARRGRDSCASHWSRTPTASARRCAT